jgi:hypothetical protein
LLLSLKIERQTLAKNGGGLHSLRLRITAAREILRSLQALLDDIAGEVATVEDQVALAEHTIRLRRLIIDLAKTLFNAESKYKSLMAILSKNKNGTE